ncbi:hypothetical protein FOZ61_010295 [Perkinsus olseni]|uniref:Glutamine synthetase n=1 Tax=Perkinsus olseni TaxID=32597 RepID=A0A7J6M386_PEROL|nr:hypothetical protein FOZ61_010295 [Perkinsus olseni]
MTVGRQKAVMSMIDRSTDTSHDADLSETQNNFGKYVFSLRVMQNRLPTEVYRQLRISMEAGRPLDPSLADTVAAAMKDWAVGLGATHFTHVFYPHTGSTAEKHESFIEPRGDGTAFTMFNGKSLIQGEPDASSFPHGGIRDTYEARGYTAWDVTSPAYLMEKGGCLTLCIPTAFVAWTGEAMDLKTPLLRSMQAVAAAAEKMLTHFVGDEPIGQVVSFCGAEQEYFLVDKKLFAMRPDLVICNRTLFGRCPAKTQQFDDHYFGAIPDRILKCMTETESLLYKLGVPIKCRHNEVAPGQFEIVPLFETANIASDHQHILMQVLDNIASKHGFKALFHEKPFLGVNGSGKHVNWSLGNSTQGNLLNPTDSPAENLPFLMFLSAVIRAVDQHAGLLRATVASASNDHRLGAQEAPPAIISVYLGDQLQDVFEQIRATINSEARRGSGGYSIETRVRRSSMTLGANTLPALNKDAGDRNRTSPFAFTGNKFEFRAVGSSESLSPALIMLNTMMAQSLNQMSAQLEERLAEGLPLDYATKAVIRDTYRDHGRVIFNGDGYSDEWKEEASRRGLKNLVKAPEALAEYGTEDSIALFEGTGVMSKSEVLARQNVLLERYANMGRVEAECAHRIAHTLIAPACMRYLTEVANTLNSARAAGGGKAPRFVQEQYDALSKGTDALGEAIKQLEVLMNHVDEDADEMAHARYAADVLTPATAKLRERVDALELLVSDDYWPLPTYQEMLFMK